MIYYIENPACRGENTLRIKFFISILFIPIFLFSASGLYAAETDPEPGVDTSIEGTGFVDAEELDLSEEDFDELYDELDSIVNENRDEAFSDDDEGFFWRRRILR